VVEGEEAGEEGFAGGGGDGVAGAVVFGEGFDFLEIVGQGEVLPAVGGEDGLVEGDMEGAEGLDAGAGFFGGEASGEGAVLGGDFAAPVAGLGALGMEGGEAGFEVVCVEEVVDVRQTEPEAEHEVAAVFVVAFADGGEVGVRRLPLPGGESEGVEAVRRRVAKVLLQRAAVFARPDFMDGGLDDGVTIPAV